MSYHYHLPSNVRQIYYNLRRLRPEFDHIAPSQLLGTLHGFRLQCNY